jgi:recombination protein RecA
MAQEGGIVEKSGSWLLYKGERLGQGRENAKAFLRDSPKLAEELEKALRAKFLVVPESQPATKAAAEKPEEPAAITKAKK